ncbi:MAG: DNA polymerase IV [candidate division WOR-3 bacterium]|nr:DNA polymerase IV [candidate division WOR-3 bacterium]
MYLCVDLDAFFVSVERVFNPRLRGKPVVVGALPGERGVVASASYEARSYGIKSGIPVSRAYKLCPHAIFIRPDFRKYEAFSEKFKEILYHYSPVVEKVSIDEAFVDIRGTERLFGPPLNLACSLKKEIRETLKLPCSIGIARTKVIAKIVCDRSKPDGLLMVEPEQEKWFLFSLPVDVLPGIGPKSVEILRNLNINNVKDFFQTPDWILEAALGRGYRLIKSFISGGDFQILNTMKSMSHETTLTEDTRDWELITGVFYQLLESLCQRLRQNRLVARVCTIKIRFSDFKTITRRVVLTSGTNSQQKIYRFCMPVLQKMLKENKRVRLIGLSFSRFQNEGLQPSIFYGSEDRLNRFNLALDSARARFGSGAIFSANTIPVYFSHSGV